MNSKHIIWSDINLDLADWADFFDEEYPDADENKRYELMCDFNNEYLDDARANLRGCVTDGEIICIADLGLWNGRHSGYKLMNTSRLSDCLYTDCDYAEWYVDGLGDMRCTAIHHDGRNSYLYRELRPELSETKKENFLDKIYRGSISRADINRYTRRLGQKIAAVYGWEVRKEEIA